MLNFQDFISRLSHSIAEFPTAYCQAQYTYIITHTTNPWSPGNICLGLTILIVILIHLSSRIYNYIHRK